MGWEGGREVGSLSSGLLRAPGSVPIKGHPAVQAGKWLVPVSTSPGSHAALRLGDAETPDPHLSSGRSPCSPQSQRAWDCRVLQSQRAVVTVMTSGQSRTRPDCAAPPDLSPSVLRSPAWLLIAQRRGQDPSLAPGAFGLGLPFPEPKAYHATQVGGVQQGQKSGWGRLGFPQDCRCVSACSAH